MMTKLEFIPTRSVLEGADRIHYLGPEAEPTEFGSRPEDLANSSKAVQHPTRVQTFQSGLLPPCASKPPSQTVPRMPPSGGFRSRLDPKLRPTCPLRTVDRILS